MKIGKNMAPLRTTLIYALFGIAWILTTDTIVEFLFSSSDPTRSLLQTIKGWLFVLLSAGLIYWFLHNDLKFLEESEERYHKLFDASIDAILLTVPTGEILAANAAACRMFDLTEQEIQQLGRNGIVDVTDPRLALALEVRARTGSFSGELTFVRGDGSKFPGEVSTAKYKDRDGNDRTSMVIRDVSERKWTEAKILHLNHLYLTISQINQVIIRAKDRATLFSEICRVAVEHGGFRMAWIGLVDETGGYVKPVAFAGEEQGYLSIINISVLDEKLSLGPTGRAIREGRCIICQDIATDPHMGPWRESALQRGYHSSASVPIYYKKQAIGAFAVYAADPQGFHDDHAKLLDEIGQDISHALDSLNVEAGRRQAEEELHRSESRFRSLIEHGLDNISLLDAEGILLWESPSTTRTLGYGQDAYKGRNILELVHPEDLEWVRSKFREILDHPSKEYHAVFRLHHADGTWHWVEGIATNLLEEPSVKAIVVNYRDVTERKVAEEKLHESELRFRQLADNIDEAFWITEAQSRDELYSSPAAEKIWGAPLEVLMQPNAFLNFVVDEDKPRVIEMLDRQIRGEKVEYEYRIRRPDGQVRWVWDRSFPIHDDVGNLISNAGITTDITDLKATRQELMELNLTLEQRVRERTAEVQDLYENAPAGYHSVDENGILVRINQTELNWLGYSREEVIGVKSFEDLITPRSREIFAENFPRFKKEGRVQDLEFEMVRKDGSILPVLLNATAIYDDVGRYVMSRSTIIDITEHKRAELTLRTANATLEKASKLKDEFLANMSHELRTPLNAILSFSESLEEGTYGKLTPRQIEIQQVIAESGRHLLELINDILDLSKVEAGKLELILETIDVESLCQSSLQMFSQAAIRKHLKISTSISSEIQTIHGDRRRIKQMLVNLLSNAIKFTHEGGQMGLEVTLEGKAFVRFTVWDTGIGIPGEKLDELFRPFTQLDSSLSRQYAGTGLGLALVRTLAELHGGRAGVESEDGKGSRFYFIIPIAQKGAGLTQLETTMNHSDKGKKKHETASILLVEDNPVNMMVTSDYLSEKGFTILKATSGEDAIEKALELHPALIIMDIQMPGLNGLETIKRLRAAPETATVPIVALTALAMPGDRERCLEAGANEYIAKPASLKELVGVIDNLLQ